MWLMYISREAGLWPRAVKIKLSRRGLLLSIDVRRYSYACASTLSTRLKYFRCDFPVLLALEAMSANV